MTQISLKKIGYYTIYQTTGKKKFKVDSGKMLFIARTNTHIKNPYRDVKYFDKMESAENYVKRKLKLKNKKKQKVLKTLPKSLYLILIREKKTGKVFVKVGFTTKKFIIRRFSKKYGYDGYIVESVLRRINTQDAEKLEDEIKKKLNKKRSIKKYRPVLESFSGYSECYSYLSLNEITKIFDSVVNKVI